MDARLQEMLDHHEIRKTLTEYCHGCDRCDEAHMASVYLEDSWDDHGRIKARGWDFAPLMTAEIRRRTNTLSHLLGQSLIKVNGDEAGAETYFIAVQLRTDNGKEMCDQLGGRYLDKLQQDSGRWLIKHRVVVRDWSISLPVGQDSFVNAGLKDGFRSNEDPSYAMLGLTHGGAHQT
jgi:hypothetical protein